MAYGTVSADVIQSSVTGVSLGAGNATRFKNRIINGNMVIDQRNAGALISSGTAIAYTLDRWYAGIGYSTGATVQQSTSAPTGFNNSLIVTVGTGAAASAANIARAYQVIEGLNVADLGWGTADAKTVTLSFWVKSSLTGTFSGGFYNSAANRSYVFTYAISAANTWEQKSVTIAGDTSGTWLTTNGAGIYINWDLGTGTTYQATSGSWQATAAWATSGSVKLAATTGATFYITGVQLEVGSSATGFEYVDYTTQLAMCQRYYYQLVTPSANAYQIGTGGTWNASQGQAGVFFPVTMRTLPTTSANSGTNYWGIDVAGVSTTTNSAWFGYRPSINYILVYNQGFSGLTGGQSASFYANNSASYMGFTAEL